jgi:hypothetical protein
MTQKAPWVANFKQMIRSEDQYTIKTWIGESGCIRVETIDGKVVYRTFWPRDTLQKPYSYRVKRIWDLLLTGFAK